VHLGNTTAENAAAIVVARRKLNLYESGAVIARLEFCLICLINTRTQCMMMAISLGAWLRFRRPFTNNLAILYSPECLEQSLLHLPRGLMPSICHMFQTNAEISPARFLEPESLRYWQLMKLTAALNFIVDLWVATTKFRKCPRGMQSLSPLSL
jgi:hypothetical protein